MSDLISREAIMKEFADFVRASNNSDFAKTPTWNDAVSLVGSLPSAQQWIPCSEKQPEETNLYWVTVKPIDSEMLEVTQRWYFGRGYGDGWEAELYEPPLAWMPMEWPDPWRGEEDER